MQSMDTWSVCQMSRAEKIFLSQNQLNIFIFYITLLFFFYYSNKKNQYKIIFLFTFFFSHQSNLLHFFFSHQKIYYTFDPLSPLSNTPYILVLLKIFFKLIQDKFFFFQPILINIKCSLRVKSICVSNTNLYICLNR
jgi:hypothetical protein